jgi:hypothetical protein
MAAHRRIVPICFFVAWIFAWVTAIYLPSALIAATHLSPLAEGRNLAAATFAVADEVAPLAKIGFALIFAAFVVGARKLPRAQGLAAAVIDALSAVAAMVLTLALLPPDWSRGFGVGLTGSRFAPEATAIYLLCAFFAGILFSVSERRCAGRRPTS